MAAPTTAFRLAVQQAIEDELGIEVVAGRFPEGYVARDGDIACVWPEGSVEREADRNFRLFELRVRIFLAFDPGESPQEGEDPTTLEDVSEAVLVRLSPGITDAEGREWYFRPEEIGFDVDANAVEFALVAEYENAFAA